MKCAWQSYINILPSTLRRAAEQYQDTLLEIRLRINAAIEMITVNGSVWLNQRATLQDLTYSINVASKYSPWSASTIAKGYITAPGGHRIGICGESVLKNGIMSGIANPTSISIRVARDFPGIAEKVRHLDGSVLIIGPPGAGKTTLLRDLIRQRSDANSGSVAVVDERREIFPYENGTASFSIGRCTDILIGCPKPQGIQIVLKNMTPRCIAVDEITSQEDCEALLNACWCGVRLLCTAHAESLEDLRTRVIYRPLTEQRIFDWLIALQPDRSWRAERMRICC